MLIHGWSANGFHNAHLQPVAGSDADGVDSVHVAATKA